MGITLCLLGKSDGAAHTDLVKCLNKTFPNEAIGKCGEYLEEQIIKYHPKLIIFNGSPVCETIMKLFPPRAPIGEFDTSYTANVKGNKVTIILSGFIKYMDNYAKRRLGVEIKKYMQELAIGV